MYISTLQKAQAHLTVSISCVLYLTSSLQLVDPRVADYLVRSKIINCFHELQLYANDRWIDHLQALAAESWSDEQGLVPLRHSLRRLTDSHNHLAILIDWTTQREDDRPSHEGLWDPLGIPPVVQVLLERVIIYRSKASSKGGSTAESNGMCTTVLQSAHISQF